MNYNYNVLIILCFLFSFDCLAMDNKHTTEALYERGVQLSKSYRINDKVEAAECFEKAMGNEFHEAMLSNVPERMLNEEKDEWTFVRRRSAANLALLLENQNIRALGNWTTQQRDNLQCKLAALNKEANDIYQTALRSLNASEGEGNSTEAFRLLQAAAALDHTGAIYEIGRILYEGTIVRQNLPEAIQLLQKAADRDHIGAMYLLGSMYEAGGLRGLIQSDNKACHWYGRVYELCGVGDSDKEGEWDLIIRDAAYRLAILYIDNRYGGEYRGSTGIEICHKLANKGDPNGQFMLGEVYYTGGPQQYTKLIGVDQDCDEAVKWLLKAADQDHIEAMFLLGQLFANGIYQSGTMKYLDPEKSQKWYQKAADNGHIEAYNQL